jgi:8-oxo-dGTP diphosphatase
MDKGKNVQMKFAILATDIALFSLKEGELVVRMIDVNRPPHFVHVPGLPGGLIQPDETALQAAKRLLQTKAGIRSSQVHLEQLFTFDAVDRDPRGRVVAVAHLGLVPWDHLSAEEQEDSANAKWVDAHRSSKLAYDHKEMMQLARKRLASRVTYTTLISKLLPKEFTLTELEQAFEIITGKEIDKRNFRKKLLKLGLLNELPRMKSGARHRPAKLYAFKSDTVQEIEIL